MLRSDIAQTGSDRRQRVCIDGKSTEYHPRPQSLGWFLCFREIVCSRVA